MIITASQASTPATAKLNSHAYQMAAKLDTRPVAKSTNVTISPEALQKAADSEGQTDEVASAYRLTGPAILVSSLHPSVYKMPEALIKEMEVRAKEEAVRLEISSQYASEHQYQTVGQVLVDGKFFAEVNDAGGYGAIQNSISGLSEAPLNPRERVEEIARAVKDMGKVEIRYSDFVPGLGGWEGPGAPESMLPPFTARSIHEIFAEAIEAAERLRSASLPPSESAVS